MKRLHLIGVLLSVSLFISACNSTASINNGDRVEDKVSHQIDETLNRTFNVDISASNVLWTASKVTATHNGNINLSSGELIVKDGLPVTANFTVDMNSLTDNDLKDADMNEKLVNYLKSETFFSTEKHPTAIFTMTSCDPDNSVENANYLVKGDMTIKGITKSISFPAQIDLSASLAKMTAKLTLDRTDWDMNFRSGSFFENLGDKLIYDEFTLDLELVAKA